MAAKEQKKVDYTKAVSILGFEPTIQNIMRIVFAHMDTFMHYFYELYGNIYAGKSDRVFTTINVQKEETDANIVGGENYLPPFFALHTKNIAVIYDLDKPLAHIKQVEYIIFII